MISITNCLHLKVAEDNPDSIRIDFADILMNVQLTSIQVIQIQLDRIETTQNQICLLGRQIEENVGMGWIYT